MGSSSRRLPQIRWSSASTARGASYSGDWRALAATRLSSSLHIRRMPEGMRESDGDVCSAQAWFSRAATKISSESHSSNPAAHAGWHTPTGSGTCATPTPPSARGWRPRALMGEPAPAIQSTCVVSASEGSVCCFRVGFLKCAASNIKSTRVSMPSRLRFAQLSYFRCHLLDPRPPTWIRAMRRWTEVLPAIIRTLGQSMTLSLLCGIAWSFIYAALSGYWTQTLGVLSMRSRGIKVRFLRQRAFLDPAANHSCRPLLLGSWSNRAVGISRALILGHA